MLETILNIAYQADDHVFNEYCKTCPSPVDCGKYCFTAQHEFDKKYDEIINILNQMANGTNNNKRR